MPNKLTVIRNLSKSDVPQMHVIETTANPHPWSKNIIKNCLRVGYFVVGLERNKELIGFLVARIEAFECHILNICVNPEQQGQGNGKRLLEHVLREAKKHKVERIMLDVRKSNEAAIALYSKYFFKEIRLRRGYYPNGTEREDGIVMELLTEFAS